MWKNISHFTLCCVVVLCCVLESGEGRYKEKQYVEEHKSLYVVLCCCVVLCCVVLCCVVLLCGVVPSLA